MIELTQHGIRLLESDVWFGSSIERHEDGSGTATILIPLEILHFYVDLVWRIGEDAKILEPIEAIEYIKRKIDSMRLRYS